MSGRSTFAHRIATLAAIGIAPSELEQLKSAWKMFGVAVQVVPYEGLRSLKDKPINAFIVRLNAAAKPVLQTIRSLDKYQHSLIYGVGGDTDILELAGYEISVRMQDLKDDWT